MNDQQINEAVAEALGWDCDPKEAREWRSRGQWCKQPPDSDIPIVWPHKAGGLISKNSHLPSYTSDLNAMHDAVKSQDWIFSKRQRYRENLQRVVTCDRILDEDTVIASSSLIVAKEECIEATARQRAEAFLKTLGKWEEQPQ